MAEIGAIASIVGLAGAGVKISLTLFDLADRVGSTGAEVKLVATELSLFCSVLQEVNVGIEDIGTTHLTPAALNVLSEVTVRCADVVADIKTTVDSLTKGQSLSTFPASNGQVRNITGNALTDDEQYRLIAQGLVLAVKSAVNQLYDLEDLADDEALADDHPVIKDASRMNKLFESLSVRSPAPPVRPQMLRRTSTWLEKLVFDEKEPAEHHPGARRYRLSSATTVNDPSTLPQKWTELPQRQRQPLTDNHSPIEFNDFAFVSDGAVAGSSEHSPQPLSRQTTFGVSPKSTLAVQIPQIPVVAAINLPSIAESPEED